MGLKNKKKRKSARIRKVKQNRDKNKDCPGGKYQRQLCIAVPEPDPSAFYRLNTPGYAQIQAQRREDKQGVQVGIEARHR